MIEFIIKSKKYLKIRLLQIFRVNQIFQIFIFFERILKSKYYKNNLLEKIFNEKNKEFYFIYDLSVSPISYGDFIYSTFFLKFLSIKNKVNLCIINDEINNDNLKRYTKKEIQERINDLKIFSNFFCDNSLNIKECSFKDIENKINKENCILYNEVKRRKSIVGITPQILNDLFLKIDNNLKEKFYLKCNNPQNDKIQENYVTLGLRINSLNELNRDVTNLRTEDQIKYLKFIISQIRKNYKHEKIVIISNPVNNDLKNIIFNIDKNILFARNELAKNFLDCGKIILNSEHYYEIFCTGISIFAEFSKIKYDKYCNQEKIPWKNPARYDLYFYNRKDQKKGSWQLENQNHIYNFEKLIS